MNTTKRIAISPPRKLRALFTLTPDQLALVVGMQGVIIESPRPDVEPGDGLGTSPSVPR